MTAWQYLIDLHSVCHFMSRERNGKVSNGELKRWIKNQVLSINGVKVKWDDVLTFPIEQCSLFTKRKKITII